MRRAEDQRKKDEEANAATWEAVRGGVVGATKWGLATGILGLGAYFYTPIYRNLTIQFKVFIQMSGMTLGGMVEADHRLRLHEAYVRNNNRLKRDAAVWRAYEEEFEKTVSTSDDDASKGGSGSGDGGDDRNGGVIHRTAGGDEEVVR